MAVGGLGGARPAPPIVGARPAPPIVVVTRDKFPGFSNIAVANITPGGRFVDVMGNPVPTYVFDYVKRRYVSAA